MCWLRFSESPLAPKFNLKKNFPPQEAHSYLTKPTPPAPRGRETVECTQANDRGKLMAAVMLGLFLLTLPLYRRFLPRDPSH